MIIEKNTNITDQDSLFSSELQTYELDHSIKEQLISAKFPGTIDFIKILSESGLDTKEAYSVLLKVMGDLNRNPETKFLEIAHFHTPAAFISCGTHIPRNFE